MEPIKRFQLVEVIVTANYSKTKVPIPDQQNLRMDSTQDIVIVGMEMWSTSSAPLSWGNQQPLPTDAQIANTALTLYVDDEESVQLMPCLRLMATRTALATSTQQFQEGTTGFKNLVGVSWEKCYFQTAVPYNNAGANAQFCLTMGVTYYKLAPGAWAKLTKSQVKGL
jgi:hypothetical protein